MFIMKTVSPNILKQLNGLVNLERPTDPVEDIIVAFLFIKIDNI